MKRYYDVIVVGGGPAGIMSAMASGKLGASTLLVEKMGSWAGQPQLRYWAPSLLFTIKTSRSSTACPKILWTAWCVQRAVPDI